MNNKTFHVGGSIEKALKGESELHSLSVLQEAWKTTAKHFLTFFPAVVGLFLAQMALLLVALQVQLGSPWVFFDSIVNGSAGGEVSLEILNAGHWANYWSDVLSAPLFVGVTLMSLNHAVGLPSKPSHLVKGLPYALIAIVTVLLSSSIQGIISEFVPLLGWLVSMCFSLAIILICEKRVTPLKALQYSTIAVLRKLLPITAIYIAIVAMFLISFATAGLGLIWTIPFFFNAKAIIYRNLFGITLQVTTVKKGEDDNTPTDKEDPQVFNA